MPDTHPALEDVPTDPAGECVVRRRPVAIDLFSGAGGLSLGFESAGFDVVSAVEYDPVHAATHLYNFPLTDVICRDIAEISAEEVQESARRGWEAHHPGGAWDGVIDAVIGGPSCQGFSTMGKQDASDERNGLIFEFVRLVEQLRPTSFCMENVPGFLAPKFDEIRGRAIARFHEAGYRTSGESLILKAESFGVPQKRRRVMIFGVRGQGSPPPAPAPLPSRTFTVRDAFEALPRVRRFRSLRSTDSLRLNDAKVISQRSVTNEYLTLSDVFGDGSGTFGHARMIDSSVLSGCRVTVHTRESVGRFGATVPGSKEAISRLYRLSESSPALTLRAGTGRERGAFSAARPLHPIEPRVITVREAARLHSFPDWFRFHTTNWHGHRQIGNAVPPLLAAAAARSVLSSLGLRPSKSTIGVIALGPATLLTLGPMAAAAFFGASDNQVPKRHRLVSD